MLWLLPLVVVVGLTIHLVAAPFSHWFDVRLTRLSLAIFGEYVTSGNESRRSKEKTLLQSAHVGQTHRIYASRTLLIAAMMGVIGAFTSVYVAAGVLFVAGIDAGAILGVLVGPLGVFAFLANLAELPSLGVARLFGLFLVATVIFGPPSAYLGYWARWRYLGAKRNARETGIDATLPRTVAFVYALSRSGMDFTKVLETLEQNQRVYGESAKEISVAVREIDIFNTDVLTALTRTAERTPSEGLEEFSDNLASVLDSGQDLPGFLHEQYERYRDEAESLQEQYLELLATLAEVYVTVLVAGPLFFITVLVVVGLVIGDTLTLIRLVTYFCLPMASVGFVVYTDSITTLLQSSVKADDDEDATAVQSVRASVAVPDEEADDAAAAEREATWERNRERLTAYDSFAPVRKWRERPFGMLLDHPEFTFGLTVPIAAFWLLGRVAALPDSATPPNLVSLAIESTNEFLSGPFVRGIDGPLIEAALIVLSIYALAHEVQKRRTRTIEQHVPDFLDRLAGVNEAGMTVTESLRRVQESELGSLGPEIDRVWADIQWGSDSRTALQRMEQRTGSVLVSQAVALITNAMRASGDISPVLRIAADEAQENRRLRRERRQEMLTYLIVIYISFFVFIGIITALSVAFIPAISEAGSSLGGASGGGGMGVPNSPVGNINEVDTEAYSLLFFHVASVQAVCSGFIAGQLGEGSIRDGAKHAAVLLTVAYLLSVVVF